MPFNAKEFADDLLKDAKVDTTLKEALYKVIEDQAVSKKLQEVHEGNLRQSDYSKYVADYQEKIKKADQYYAELAQWKKDEMAKFEAERAAIRATQGQGTQDQITDQQPSYLSKAEFETELSRVQNGAVQFMATLSEQSVDYLQRFGKKLDTKALLKKAQDDQTNIVIAYERFIQPELEAQRKKELDELIARERESAKKEALASITIPVSTTVMDSNPHPLDGLNPANKEKFGWKAAAQAHAADIRAGKLPVG